MQNLAPRIISLAYLVTVCVAVSIMGLGLASGQKLSDITPIALAIIVAGFGVGITRDLVGFGCIALFWLPFSRGFFNQEWGVVTVDGYMAAMLVLSGSCFVSILYSKRPFRITVIDVLLGLICTVFLCSTLLSENQLESGYLAVHAIFIPVLTYFAMKSLVIDEDSLRKLVAAFILGAVAFTVFVLKDYVLTGLRVETFKVPAISIGAITLSALVLLSVSGGFSKVTKTILGALLLTGVYATFTRVFLLLAIVAPVLYWAVRRGAGTPMLLSMLSISLMGTVMLAASGETFRPTSTYDASAGNVTEGRLTNINAWKEALYARSKDVREGLANFEANPVVGTGLHRGVFVTRHNFHVAWLEYGGIVGYLAYVGLFTLHFVRAASNVRRRPEVAGGLVVIFAILTNGITNGFMHGYMPIIAFLVLGLNEGIISNLALARAASKSDEYVRVVTVPPSNLLR